MSFVKRFIVLQVCHEVGCEHPSINPDFRGKSYRYAYVTGWLNSINRGHFANAVTKINLENGQTIAWRGDNFSHPGMKQSLDMLLILVL